MSRAALVTGGSSGIGLAIARLLREEGFDVSMEAWRGIAVPRGTPRSAVSILESAIRQAIESREFQRGSENLFVRPAFLRAEDFSPLIAQEDAALARLMERVGQKK